MMKFLDAYLGCDLGKLIEDKLSMRKSNSSPSSTSYTVVRLNGKRKDLRMKEMFCLFVMVE